MKQSIFLTTKIRRSVVLCILLLLGQAMTAQEISFGSSGLSGENVLNPTSIDFGPDGKLYVSQQDGTLWRFGVTRDNADSGEGSYSVTESESILLIKNGIQNHNDDGIPNNIKNRQVTGILTAGTAENPILYVTSSDYLVGGGKSGIGKDLDTNSSMLSRLTWDGSAWQKVDLIRGLPRCEENHSVNGLEFFERDGIRYLLVQQGGHSNKGAPSNNFVGTPEYLLSGALLIVNLTQLENMPIYLDPRSNTEYVYDLPTLNDPNRPDIDNTDINFPYPAGHPLYNATIDLGDPFGGDDGLNQAFTEDGGPVQIFSPGYRNAYDVVVTENGRIYTFDNGPNNLWGGLPVIYTSDGQIKGDESTTTYNPENGDYIKNDFNENGSLEHGDALHFVGTINDTNGTYYGGHPNPIAAFPSRADLITYKNISGVWQETSRFLLENLLQSASGYFQSSFTIADFPDDPRQGEYLADAIASPKVRILDIINSSTNGMCEYTASTFDNALKGSLLSASFNGNIYQHTLTPDGTNYDQKSILFNGFGSIPLDLIALPDGHPYAGTVWAVTYGENNITVFEPANTICTDVNSPDFDPTADDDNDGYSNQDELDNNTNPCSGGSTPEDFDKDFLSDLNDQDDDNDGILDINDAYAIDPTNGTNTNLPINYPFWNNDPGTGFSGLGFTGLMLDPTGSTDYLTQFDNDNLDFGGATGKASIILVPSGDAIENLNTQQYAFQFGVNVDQNSNPFTISSRIESPFFGINGSPTSPAKLQSAGIFIGTGDQDNYLKIVIGNGLSDDDDINGVEVLLENNGVATRARYDIENLLAGNAVDIFVSVDPLQNNAQPYVSLDGGITTVRLGPPVTLPQSFLDPTDAKGLAVGIIATSFTNVAVSEPFSATWDFIKITENQSNFIEVPEESIAFEDAVISSPALEQVISIQNLSTPFDPAVTISEIAISGPDSALFSTTATTPVNLSSNTSLDIPITFTPDENTGTKNATLSITYAGSDTPLLIPITATLIEPETFIPTIRINAGGSTIVATDQGPDWLANDQTNSFASNSYSVNTGISGTFNLPYSQKHTSIPSYIDETTYGAIFGKERWDANPEPEMEFNIPIANGNHIVNLYLGNGWSGTAQEGKRIYSIEIEGLVVKSDLDLIAEFGGNLVGGMLSFPTTVFDENISIKFLHQVQNPLINAIEILSSTAPQDIVLNDIEDTTNNVSDNVDFAVAVSGGDPTLNFTYELAGQPDGIIMEPTNGQISGIIDESALDGGPAHDGVHLVTVTVSQEGIEPVSKQFTWTILPKIPLAIVTPEEQNSTEGETVSLQIETTGSSTFQYSATGLPPLLTIDQNTGLISGTINTEQNSQGAFIEENGLVVIEAENAEIANTSWSLEERDGATGIISGSNYFHSQNGSTLNYDIEFNTPGIYRVVWRSDFSGGNPTDENDSWIKFDNNDDTWFFAQACQNCGEANMANNLDGLQKSVYFPKGSSRVTESTTPRGSGSNGWFKGYRSGSAGWNWVAATSDKESYLIYLRVLTPGVRTLQISERSKGHIIDKIALYKVDGINYTDSELTNSIESTREGATANPDGIYNVTVTAVTEEEENLTTNFTWNITPEDSLSPKWIDKNENENYVARHECSFVQAGESFIMFGGRESSQRLDVYDYASDSWSQGGEAPVEFNHFQATTYKDLVWVIGAFKTNTFPNEAPADYIYMYNPATQEWIQGIEIPEDRRRGGAGLVVHNDKFYIIGGNTIGHNGGYVAWFDEYDPATGTWTVLPDAPHARDHFHATMSNGKLYAAGGRLSGGPGGTFAPVIPEVDVYDFATSSWSVLENNLPTPRAAAGVVTFENEIYVIGGETSDQNLAYDTVEAYNPLTGEWTSKQSLNHPRHGTQAILSGEGIYIAGGSPNRGGGSQKNMEVYKSDNPTGTPITASTLSTPSTSIEFYYTDDVATVTLDPIALANSDGTTATFIKDVMVTGIGFELSGIYTNTLLDPNTTRNLEVQFNETSLTSSTGTILVTYDNGQTLSIALSGNQGVPPVEIVRYRINAGGISVPAEELNWDQDLPAIIFGRGIKGVASPYVNTAADDKAYGSALFSNWTNNTAYPDTIFETMRFSSKAAPNNQQWDFPVVNGDYKVNLLFAESWVGAKEPGVRFFDIYIEETKVAENFDIVGNYGWVTAGVASFRTTVNDQNLDIDFGKLSQSPMIAGIEIIELSSGNIDPTLAKPAAVQNADEFLEEHLTIYPIPATSTVTFELKGTTEDSIKDIEIRNSTGLLVKQLENNKLPAVEIPINDLIQGIYIAKITSVNGGVITRKLSIF